MHSAFDTLNGRFERFNVSDPFRRCPNDTLNRHFRKFNVSGPSEHAPIPSNLIQNYEYICKSTDPSASRVGNSASGFDISVSKMWDQPSAPPSPPTYQTSIFRSLVGQNIAEPAQKAD